MNVITTSKRKFPRRLQFLLRCVYFNGTMHGPEDSSCSMRQRHFVIKPRASREVYPADYLKFKWRARETDAASAWINVYKRRIELNPPVFRCRRLSVSDWREVTGDPSRDAIKLVISPAARPLQPVYGEIIDHHEIIVIVISRMFIDYSTKLGPRKV